jgi:hypothetical protein
MAAVKNVVGTEGRIRANRRCSLFDCGQTSESIADVEVSRSLAVKAEYLKKIRLESES